MADNVLKGNFKTAKKVAIPKKSSDINQKFEHEALKRLGGSIAFVSKKNFVYGLKKPGDSKTSH